jgi:mannose-6-phosphate isomerase-like protein (cupin superfamily)
MTVELEGGCRVAELREGRPTREGALAIWTQVGRAVGARAISLRVLELGARGSAALRNANCDEVLYVLAGRGTFFLGDREWPIQTDSGLYLPPGRDGRIECAGPESLVLASSRCPEPEPGNEVASMFAANKQDLENDLVVQLAARPSETTGDRWYKTLIGKGQGCEQVTQFVGAIPHGRAPDHFHHYEEVLCILRGSGRMWAGKTSTPIGPGSCVFLPRGQVHCVENTGDEELVLLGVFYPAGSPAVRYDADSASRMNAILEPDSETP